jgi:hypothetical protein
MQVDKLTTYLGKYIAKFATVFCFLVYMLSYSSQGLTVSEYASWRTNSRSWKYTARFATVFCFSSLYVVYTTLLRGYLSVNMQVGKLLKDLVTVFYFSSLYVVLLFSEAYASW